MLIDEWWTLVDKQWLNLLSLIEKFHPTNRDGDFSDEFKITAPMAEKACESVRQTVTRPIPVTSAIQAKEFKDSETLYKILNETWFGLPESSEVRSLPGFFTLCDLCSEYEGENDFNNQSQE